MSNLPANRKESAPTPLGRPAQLPAIGKASAFSLTPTSLEEGMKFAELIAKSTICPKQFQGRPGDVLVAVMMGMELGVSPLQALSGIAVIDGRATVWGDLGIALVQRTGLLEYLLEDWSEEKQLATVRIKRRGMPAKVFTFGMADARKARLADKDTYRQYPSRMCGWRAKTYAIRSEFADALKGLLIAEESMDLPPESEPIDMPEPIRMPRAVGEAPEAQETDQPDRLRVAPDLSIGEPEEAPEREADPEDDRIFVVATEKKDWTDKKSGKVKHYYVVELSDGTKASTFSATFGGTAKLAFNQRLPVRYKSQPGKKEGTTELTAIEVVELDPAAAPRDEAAEAPAEGASDAT